MRYFAIRSNSYKGDEMNNVHLLEFSESDKPYFEFVDNVLFFCNCESSTSISSRLLPKIKFFDAIYEIDKDLNIINGDRYKIVSH